MRRGDMKFWWLVLALTPLAFLVCANGPSVGEVVVIDNVVVFDQPGKFCGWPANNGIWNWGDDEILVGFTRGDYRTNDDGHAIDRDAPIGPVQARSLDGGRTWQLEEPAGLTEAVHDPIDCPGGLDFTNPGFAMKCGGIGFFAGFSGFLVTNDRGKTWTGPFRLPPPPEDATGPEIELTPRTDYMVNGPRDCFFFLSARKVDDFGTDRAYCARTTDGGATIQFLSWINPEPYTVRGVMPSTVRISKTDLVSALRRKTPDRNWIDVFLSKDDGASWAYLSTVTETDRDGERRNGNPPCLVRLDDGRLCVTYGFRAKPCGIRARLSGDDGKTWGEEITLRQDALTCDIGYTRTVQRPDGNLVTVYYYVTEQNPEQHIAATIWSPAE